jgi:CotS family spore coat protein
MLETRYRDKNYLSKYDLSVELFKKFNLKVNDVVPLRNVYILSTDKGEKVFKKIDYPIEDLELIHKAMIQIKTNFNRVLDFALTCEGKPYTKWNGDIYCVMDLLPGRECDFNNLLDLSIASKGLGELHNATQIINTFNFRKNMVGKLIDTFKRKLIELELFKSIAQLHENKTDFDNLFLKNFSYHADGIRKSIMFLESSPYNELCMDKNNIVLCHHDLAYHNIIINEEKAYFIDFDYAILDLKVHDICNLMNKAIKNFAFDIERVESILENYKGTNTLDEKELKVLYGMLLFPEDFYSVSKDYYTRRKDWEEEVFLDRLIKKISYKEDRREFLEEYKNRIIY